MDANRSATALLIDEDPGSQQANQRRLEDDGFTVVVARDVNSGLAQARHLLPGVIFMHLVSGEAGRGSFLPALRGGGTWAPPSALRLRGAAGAPRGSEERGGAGPGAGRRPQAPGRGGSRSADASRLP